jgi:hypothetical protein
MSLREATIELRRAQRAYMADRGNQELGAAVAAAAQAVDECLECPCGAPTCTEAWEPGCELGMDERFVKVVPPEEEIQIVRALYRSACKELGLANARIIEMRERANLFPVARRNRGFPRPR